MQTGPVFKQFGLKARQQVLAPVFQMQARFVNEVSSSPQARQQRIDRGLFQDVHKSRLWCFPLARELSDRTCAARLLSLLIGLASHPRKFRGLAPVPCLGRASRNGYTAELDKPAALL